MTVRRPRIVVRSVVALVLAAVAAASGATAAPAPSRTGVRLPTVDGIPPIYWSGHVWTPTPTGCSINGDCFRSMPDTLFLDNMGRLHLRIVDVNNAWYSSELSTTDQNFGYGTYRWVVDTPPGSLDPASVLGLFTYNGIHEPNAPKSKDPHVGHLEADFEVTRWRSPLNRYDLQETVQPYWNPANIRRIPLPDHQSPLTFEFTWAPSGTTFVVRRGAGATAPVLRRWSAPVPIGTPRPGTKVVLDFWNFHGPPLSYQPQEVVVESFNYTPAA